MPWRRERPRTIYAIPWLLGLVWTVAAVASGNWPETIGYGIAAAVLFHYAFTRRGRELAIHAMVLAGIFRCADLIWSGSHGHSWWPIWRGFTAWGVLTFTAAVILIWDWRFRPLPGSESE